MIGLVIVSHSYSLAEALAALARQMAPAALPIAIAGGSGPDHQDFGTNALEIVKAIQSVYQEEGGLVFSDLGSAILSAEMARDLLPKDQQSKVHLSAAPLVEGFLAAAVQASLEQPLSAVESEAIRSLTPKQEQLTEETAVQPQPTLAQPLITTPTNEIVIRLTNPHGLHARPAALFVQTVLRFDAQVSVQKRGEPNKTAPGNSLNALTALGAVQGDEIQISAQGKQSQEVLQALQMLLLDKIPAKETVELSTTPQAGATINAASTLDESVSGTIQGIPVSAGIAIAPAIFTKRRFIPPPQIVTGDPASEWNRLQDAIQRTQGALEKRYHDIANKIGTDQAAIFKAHQWMLQDPLLLEKAHQLIMEKQHSAVSAWQLAIEETIQNMAQVKDPYIQQRSADVRDVGNQVLQELLGTAPHLEKPNEKGILLADELNPNDIAQLDPHQIVGVITHAGSATSHAAILLRGLGIPAVSGIDLAILRVKEGEMIAMDGGKGLLWLRPSADLQKQLQSSRENWVKQRLALFQARYLPAITTDGVKVDVYANVSSLAEAQIAFQSGAEGIGVLRTEFLFLKRQTPPSEEEQVQLLEQIAIALNHQPIIVRTLDIGGDKSVPYIAMPHEANPYLGVRAVRLSFQYPDLFLTQLRAILRVSKDYPLRIMLPMIATAEDIIKSRMWLEKAHQELEEQNIDHGWPIELGIMVEIPSAALISNNLADLVDFFSIGTNDLTQYTMAAERGNPSLADYSDALHPAILLEINNVVQSAHAKGKWAAVCGEIASEPIATPLLIGLGVDELSLVPSEIPNIKSIIRSFRLEEARLLAQQALKCSTAQEVRQLAETFLKAQPPTSTTA